MKRILIGVCALAVGFTMTSGALAQAPNNPVFSLWVTGVYDTWGGPNKCGLNCPTQHLPVGIAEPGDIIRLEAYLSNWDAQVARGFCNGDPAHNGANSCSPTGSTSGCVGKHCANTGLICVNDLQCAGSVCLDNLCQYFPRIGAYQWTLLGQSLNSGSAGQLTTFTVPCIADDCDLLSDGQCACAHFYSFPHECTCVNPVNAACDAVTSLCGFGATRFIEKTRSDALFFGKSASEIIGFPTTQDIEIAGYLNNPVFDAVIDSSPSIKKYLGTVLLEASPTAAGIFTVTFLKNPGNTLVSDANGISSDNPAVFNSYIYQDLIISIIGQCCPLLSCDDGDACTIDNRDCSDVDCQSCEHIPKTCSLGDLCDPLSGNCEPGPDGDGDSIPDMVDNCPVMANPNQADQDNDGAGDVCDICPGFADDDDSDADGVPDGCDNCTLANPEQADCQPNGIGDICDTVFNLSIDCNGNTIPDECEIAQGTALDCNSDGILNECETDTDGDSVPDVCDICAAGDDHADFDGDGIPDGCDDCPNDEVNDADMDGLCAPLDNCPLVFNENQNDCDVNGLGDLCDQLCHGQIAMMTFPVDGAVDAREDIDQQTGNLTGLMVFDVSFSCFVGIPPTGSPPGISDFQMSDTTGFGITVIDTVASDSCFLRYSITIEEPLLSGEWTTIATTVAELYSTNMFPVSATLLADVGFLPGDVNGDSITNSVDLLALGQFLSQGGPLTPWLALSMDIDRSETGTALDLIRAVDLLNGANTSRTWNGVMLPPKPN